MRERIIQDGFQGFDSNHGTEKRYHGFSLSQMRLFPWVQGVTLKGIQPLYAH